MLGEGLTTSGRRSVATKRRERQTQRHGITSQKTCIRYNTAVKVINFAEVYLVFKVYEQLIKELNDAYYSPSIVRVIKARRMRWTEHVTRMRRGEAYTGEET